MATQIRVLIAILAVTLVGAEQSAYNNRVRRRPMLSPQERPDLGASESEQDAVIYQGPPSDFNPSPQIPDESRSDNDQAEIGGLTVQDPPKGWPFSDIALQEKFQEQIQQDESAQRQQWATPPEQGSKQHRYRQGRLLDGNSKGRKEQSSREEGSGEQTYREYSKKKRIDKPSHSQGQRIRQPTKQFQQETSQPEEQPQQYHPDQFEQQRLQQDQQKIRQEQFASPEPILQEDLTPRSSKKTSKRRPNSSANTGGPSAVNVGYSLNFGNQEGGRSNRNSVGIVQNEVVHGEGAVSYSNAQLGNSHPDLRTRPNADSIDGRPIYVPPIPSNYNRVPQQNFQSDHESLPSPAALVGEEDVSNNYSPEGVSVKSTSHFEIGQSPDAPHIISHLDHSGQYESVKPTKPPTILHINDGSDFKWKNLGNGVEISAAVTPNGLKGGYRESIPIQEDNDDDIPNFDKKPPVFIPPVPPKPIVFNNGNQFEDPNLIFSGPLGESIEGNFPQGELLPTPQELTSNHIFEEPTPKIPSAIQTAPPPPFTRRPNIYNHNFAEPPPPPQKVNEDVTESLGFPKFPEMNKVYFLPSNKPGEAPIPTVVMPLSFLRQIAGSLDSQSTAHLGHDLSTVEFMKMLLQNEAGLEPASQFPEHRPTKQRSQGFNPNKGHQIHEGHTANRPQRTHHRYQQNYNNMNNNNNNNNKFNVGPYGVKITKSIPIYEQHSVSPQNEASHGQWNTQPKHAQHFNIPLDAYESLRPSSGSFKSRPSHYREEGFSSGSGRQQYRHARQNHQANRDSTPAEPHGNSHTVDGESFAVSSSYRIGQQGPSGWNKHGRN